MFLRQIVQWCKPLEFQEGFRKIVEQAWRLESILRSPEERDKALASGEIVTRVKVLREAIGVEFDAQQFYFVPATKAVLFNKSDLFGPRVKKKFKKASFHIAEAGNCMALDRSTAAVFHLMCVLEVGLDSLAHALQVPYSQNNWGQILRAIKKAASEMPTGAPNYREDHDFYSVAVLEFEFFKDAWRNHVAHGRGKYDAKEAGRVFDHVKVFMEHLATRLKERP